MKIKVTLVSIALSILMCFPTFAANLGEPDKMPVGLSDGLVVCPGTPVSVYSGKNQGYVKINGKVYEWSGSSDRDPHWMVNLTPSDSGQWEVCLYSNKTDRWLTPEYYNVKVASSHNMVNGKCTICGREQGAQYTWSLISPLLTYSLPNISKGTSSSGLGHHVIFLHEGDRITHQSTSGHSNFRISSVGTLWVEECSRSSNGYYQGPLVLSTPGTYSYDTLRYTCRKDEHSSAYDDTGNIVVSPHVYQGGSCAICGYNQHTHNFSTFVSYATAPTCTSAGVGT